MSENFSGKSAVFDNSLTASEIQDPFKPRKRLVQFYELLVIFVLFTTLRR